MFDVFYLDKKPYLFSHERLAKDIDHARTLSRTRFFWIVNYLCDYTDWDWIWEPSPWQSHQRHAWRSRWQVDCGTYLIPRLGFSDTNYHGEEIPVKSDPARWLHVPEDFDITWHPDYRDPPYIYQFGTQWQKTGGPRYVIPGATEIKYVDHPRVVKTTEDNFWEKSLVPDHDVFDWSWHPDDRDPPYIYQFGTQWQKTGGPRYVIPGATEIKYVDHPRYDKKSIDPNWNVPDNVNRDSFDWTWHPDSTDLPYIYKFPTQWNRAGGPEYIVPGATEIKFVNTQVAKMLPTDRCWEIPAGTDIKDFDFSWTPDPTDPPYIYQFGTQWQKTGGPRYVVPGATEIKYVDQIKAEITMSSAMVVIVDHLDGSVDLVCEQIRNRAQILRTARYVDNYFDTLKRIARNCDDDVGYLWICSSICDYQDFNFTWHPEQWQASMLHVFASGTQKFGDTFLMHVPSFCARCDTVKLLDWYDLNFVSDILVPRRPMPIVLHDHDTHVNVIKSMTIRSPLITLTNKPVDISKIPDVSLWDQKSKNITPLDRAAGTVIVPRESLQYVKSQLYDYPYIDKSHRDHLVCEPQDVIFISNGEPMAEDNWKRLLQACPRARRSDGITGRELAYKTAASISTTPWFYAVFAKTEVLTGFVFDYQPDMMQQAKHYIFHSRNPLNGLEYGAMNINLYNRQLVLDTKPGLDFTLSAPHEVVPICASVSRFNTDPWITWRSAFREVLKLKKEVDHGGDVEIQYRLRTWCTKAQGENAEHCLQGAADAIEYYHSVDGDYNKLRYSFDWDWLQEYYYKKYQHKIWLESL